MIEEMRSGSNYINSFVLHQRNHKVKGFEVNNSNIQYNTTTQPKMQIQII